MNKKIIISVTNDLSQDQRMRRIAKSLSKMGNEVHLVGSSKKQSIELDKQIYNQSRLLCFFERGFLFYVEYNIRLLFFVLSKEVDILYSVDLDTILPMTLVGILRSKKHIHDAHEYFVEVPELNGRKLKKMIWSLVAKFCYPRCQSKITVNENLALELSKVYGGHWDSIMNVPQSFKQSHFPKSEKIVIYQGMLNKGRGLEEAIKVIAKLDVPIQLWIIGKGDIEQELIHLKNDVDFYDKVKFLGWKTIDEMRTYSFKSWIGINLLSCDSKNYYFSLANKFFEYIHCGIPSVSMNFPVYNNINKESEVAVLIDNIEEETIRNAILNLYHDEHFYNRLKVNTEKLRLEYNWEREEEKLKYIIKNLEQS